MFAKEPTDLDDISDEMSDREILRFGLAAELDAINFYEQMAEYTDDDQIKEVLLDVAAEEKEHVGEFETMLLERDEQQVEMGEEGKEEVREMLGK
ncbi:MAG: ferritin-like domain-containing protein [Candidatus Thermoplasmatota archaeon]|nr:ferritin-like domain-containing protein [Candidatus Thermoplasmatota archaeon]